MARISQQTEMIDRVRALVADEPSVREVSMFGGRSFMVRDAMVVSAMKTGDLLVRIDPGRATELRQVPGASPAEMGTGRTMGPGWLSVAGDAVADDERLAFWLDVALQHNRSLTERGGSPRLTLPPTAPGEGPRSPG